MKRRVKFAVLLIVGVLIILQFIQPEKNQGNNARENDLISMASVPDSLAFILVNSCYDCHSNHTEYPWYSKISPVSWYLQKHVDDGKEELNLSEYGNLSKPEKIGVLSDMYDALESGTMPLRSYLLIHRDASLNADEIDALLEWADRESISLMRN